MNPSYPDHHLMPTIAIQFDWYDSSAAPSLCFPLKSIRSSELAVEIEREFSALDQQRIYDAANELSEQYVESFRRSLSKLNTRIQRIREDDDLRPEESEAAQEEQFKTFRQNAPGVIEEWEDEILDSMYAVVVEARDRDAEARSIKIGHAKTVAKETAKAAINIGKLVATGGTYAPAWLSLLLAVKKLVKEIQGILESIDDAHDDVVDAVDDLEDAVAALIALQSDPDFGDKTKRIKNLLKQGWSAFKAPCNTAESKLDLYEEKITLLQATAASLSSELGKLLDESPGQGDPTDLAKAERKIDELVRKVGKMDSEATTHKTSASGLSTAVSDLSDLFQKNNKFSQLKSKMDKVKDKLKKADKARKAYDAAKSVGNVVKQIPI